MKLGGIDLDALNKLTGSRVEGYTSEDVEETSQTLRRVLGLEWLVIWDYIDEICTGGCSEEFLRDPESGTIYPQPDFLYELLFESKAQSAERVEQELRALEPATPAQLGVSSLAELEGYDRIGSNLMRENLIIQRIEQKRGL